MPLVLSIIISPKPTPDTITTTAASAPHEEGFAFESINYDLNKSNIRLDAALILPALYEKTLEILADYLDALEFLTNWNGDPFDTILIDPPNGYRKGMELYKDTACSFLRKLKEAILRLPVTRRPSSHFSYQSVAMGKGKKFKP